MPSLTIQSHRGPYSVVFGTVLNGLSSMPTENAHFILDAKIARLYAKPLARILASSSVLLIEALESNKSLEKIPAYVTHLLNKGARRDHRLICIGGGIVQDVTAFIASCLFRGIAWEFYPTTLLAQSDSCIGSKSSINVGSYKNQVGTFTPPERVFISPEFLSTLSADEIRSGIGEMIKVHIIGGREDAARISRDMPRLLSNDPDVIGPTLFRSLEIKKKLIELDEFDQNERLVMNYGHTFGHAIEGATGYKVPHGIAVSMGISIANDVSLGLGLASAADVDTLRPMLEANYRGFERTDVPSEQFFGALLKDKKNIGQDVRLVLFRHPGGVFLHRASPDEKLRGLIMNALQRIKGKAVSC